MDDRIISVDYADEMKRSYLDYAMSVIIQRAIPDVRDGLKPVHRRILYAMEDLSCFPDKPHRKSARIVGETMGKYHPHGDSSIYEALVRMSQDYSLMVPLIDGHGNFGSIDGDGAAAMRYTEARLSKPTLEIMRDMDKDVIDYRDNFDNTLKEPTVLPSRLPNLLVNGSKGVAVGMKTEIPTHNLTEVINACKAYLENENSTSLMLMKHISGPDFPTGGIITNKSEMASLYETGNGKIKIRSKIEIEDISGGKTNLVVTEIPYSFSGSKTRLIESLIEMVKTKKLDELSDVRDESSKDGIRLVLEVKRGIDIPNFLKKLYQKTKLEDTIGVNFLAIVNNKPEVLSLRDMIKHFIEFQREINIRKFNYLLEKAKDKKEIVEGLIKAQDIIDLIIEILRGSKDVKAAKECLMSGTTQPINFKSKKSEKDASKLDFTERQAVAILDMKLQKLIGLELQKLMDEDSALIENMAYYQKLLTDKKALNALIKAELEAIKKSFGSERKTIIDDINDDAYVEETKAEEEVYVLIDKFGYAKTIDLSSYLKIPEDVLVSYQTILKVSSSDKLAIFTDLGNLYQIKISEIPSGKIKDKGALIQALCQMEKEEIILIESVETLNKTDLLFVTEMGYSKQVSGKEFESVRKLTLATKVDVGDKVVFITATNPNTKELVLLTRQKLILKFKLSEVSLQKKNARGVMSIKLDAADKIEECYTLSSGEKKNVKINGKSVAIDKLSIKGRNTKGNKI